MRNVREQSYMQQGQCRRRSEVAPGPEQELPQPRRGPWRSRLSFCNLQVPSGADLHMQPWRSPQAAAEVAEGAAAYGYPHRSSSRPEL